MFENKIYEGIHYSRFVASFSKKGEINYKFKKWLKQLIINGKSIPEDVIICDIIKIGLNYQYKLFCPCSDIWLHRRLTVGSLSVRSAISDAKVHKKSHICKLFCKNQEKSHPKDGDVLLFCLEPEDGVGLESPVG